MKFRFSLSIGIAGAIQEEIVDIPDDWAEEDIEEEYQLWSINYLDGGWKEMEEKV